MGDDPGVDEAASRARGLAVVGLVSELLALARPAGTAPEGQDKDITAFGRC